MKSKKKLMEETKPDLTKEQMDILKDIWYKSEEEINELRNMEPNFSFSWENEIRRFYIVNSPKSKYNPNVTVVNGCPMEKK